MNSANSSQLDSNQSPLRYAFNYPFLTDTKAHVDMMQIVPSGHDDFARRIDEATGRFVADVLNRRDAEFNASVAASTAGVEAHS